MTDAERCKGGLGTIVTFLVAVVSVLTVLAVFGEEPSGEVSAFFASRKIERGMIENPNPVCGLEAEAEWFGLHAGVEYCVDMTGSRAGRYNEIAPAAGYSFAPVEWAELDARYVFKQEVGEHTHELEAEARFPLPWCVPHVGANVDVGEIPGAFYGVLGVSSDVVVCDALTLTPEIGMGFGNARRNAEDFDCNRDAARDVHVGLEADWKILENVHLCPFVTVYEQFTKAGRDAHFGNGYYCVAGCAAKVTF